MKRLSQRETALIVAVVVFLALSPLFPYLTSQHRNLSRIRHHIDAIQPAWNAFRKENPGCEFVGLFSFTGEDGMLLVRGSVAGSNDLIKLEAFIKGTQPPRPVLNWVRVSDRSLQDYREIEGVSWNAGSTNSDKKSSDDKR